MDESAKRSVDTQGGTSYAAESYGKTEGQPFTVIEIKEQVESML